MRFGLLATALVGAAALAAILATTLCSRPREAEVLAPRANDLGGYVGTDECARCHGEIVHRQSHSRMARALVTGRDYLRQHELPLPAEIADGTNGLVYRVDARQGELFLQVSRGPETAEAEMSFALGSGQRGLTFVRDRDSENYEELRISYYADTHTWDLTPGQEGDRPTSLEACLGRLIPKRSNFACLNCHSSLLIQNAGKIDVESSRFGVDCQRCHGPCGEHVRTANSGTPAKTRPPALSQALASVRRLNDGGPSESQQDEILRFVATAGDDRLVRDLYICGECHGRRQVLMDPHDEDLARFQVAALLASECYRRSADKLRCTDCHDPHGDAVHSDERPYVAVCLRCHSTASAVSSPDGESDGPKQSRACPKNSRAGCIGCHMPVTSPMYRTHFTNHRIGIYAEQNRHAAEH